MCWRLCAEGVGRHSTLKWRMNRGVTGLRPPPGEVHAAAMVISLRAGRKKEEQIIFHKLIISYMFSMPSTIFQSHKCQHQDACFVQQSKIQSYLLIYCLKIYGSIG